MNAILQYQTIIRLSCFIGMLLVMALWELISQRRHQTISRRQRWPANLALIFLSTVAVKLLIPVSTAAWAIYCSHHNIGLFHYFNLSIPLNLLLSLLLLDLAIYWQHRLFHYIPSLWRIHRMHHSDLEFDVTTGIRFHPVEIILSILIKLAVITVLGVNAVAIILFEVILNATSLFNHGNVNLALSIDKVLRLVIVTPDMHRVHHSIIPQETNSNFGFNLSLWDRLFNSYRAQPQEGHQGMTIGLEQFRQNKEQGLIKLLTQPVR